MKGSVLDLSSHGQHFYLTVLSHIRNCFCRVKLNYTASRSQCAVGQWPLCVAVFIKLCTVSCITATVCCSVHNGVLYQL